MICNINKAALFKKILILSPQANIFHKNNAGQAKVTDTAQIKMCVYLTMNEGGKKITPTAVAMGRDE